MAFIERIQSRRSLFMLSAAFLGLVASVNGAASLGKHLAQSEDKQSKINQSEFGLLLRGPKAFQGYTLFAPCSSNKTFLIDMDGRVVHVWLGDSIPTFSAYLLPNGNLLRASARTDNKKLVLGGRVQEFNWDGQIVWDFTLTNDKGLSHHDVPKLPNGNVLMILKDKKSDKEAGAAGRRGGGAMISDSIIEVRPTGKTAGEIIWEWHVWDHLIQDNDSTKANYGKVSNHPELIDVNFGGGFKLKTTNRKDLDKVRGIGYFGGSSAAKTIDWTHINCVAYNAALDQIILTVPGFNEFWIIDHGTSTSEAAGHSGGHLGRGGDILYRWGNPLAYRAGSKKDQQLFTQHNAHWIPPGLPGEGHVLLFNNGNERPDGMYSTVEEFTLPLNAIGLYDSRAASAFEPEKPVWSYASPKRTDFYSFFLSGAQRLPNGNTLICSGANGVLFEVTPEKETVWYYVNPVLDGPVGIDGTAKGGSTEGGGKTIEKAVGGHVGPGAGGTIFRAYRYAPDYSGLIGRDLRPGETIEEQVQKGSKKIKKGESSAK